MRKILLLLVGLLGFWGAQAQVALLRLSNAEFLQYRENPEELATGNWANHAGLQWFDGMRQLNAHRHSSDLPVGNYVYMYLQDEDMLAFFFVKTPFQPSMVFEGFRTYITWLDENGELVPGLQPKIGKRGYLKPELDGKRFLLDSRFNFKTIELQNSDCVDFVRVSYRDYRGYNNYYNRPLQKNFYGYIATNKPTYRLGDTLKIKIYAQFEEGTPVSIPAIVQLKLGYKLLKTFDVLPIRPGVFGLEVVLSDSMDLSNNYQLVFSVPKSEHQSLTNSFALEQYNLDEGKLDLIVKKSDLINGDTLEIQGMLQDEVANPIAGASVQVLITGKPLFFHKQLPRVSHVPDTLFFNKISTDSEGHFHLKWPTKNLPRGMTFRLSASAKATLPSGKLLEKTAWAMAKEKFEPKLKVERNFDQICISHPDSGKAWLVRRDHQDNLVSDSIGLPFCFPSEPMVAYYEVERGEDKQTFKNMIFGSVLWVTSKSVEKGLEISIQNPHKLLVKAKLLKTRSESYLFDFRGDTAFFIPLKPFKEVELYLHYVNFGKVEVKQLALARAESRLQIAANIEETGWPGQENRVEISVVDYEAQPVADVDLTVIGYNAQLPGDNIPNLKDYSYQPVIKDNPLKWSFDRTTQKTASVPVTKKLVELFQNRDTLFYNLLLESDSIQFHFIPLTDTAAPPEFAVYPVEKGKFVKPKYISYHNKVVYFDGIGQPYSYPFPSSKGFYYLEVRLDNQLVTRSLTIPMRTGYKTVFSLHVPESAEKKMDLSEAEVKKIAKSFLFFQTEAPVLVFDFKGQTKRQFKVGWDRFAVGPFYKDAELPLKVHNQRQEVLHLPVKTGTINKLDFFYRMVYSEQAPIDKKVWSSTRKLHIDFEEQHHKAIDTAFFYTPTFKDRVMALKNVQQAPSAVSGGLSLVQTLGNFKPVSNPGNSYLLVMRQDSVGNWLPYLYPPDSKHPTSLRPGRYVFVAFEFERGAYKVYKGSATILAHHNNIVKIYADRVLNWWEIDSAAHEILKLIEDEKLYDLHIYFDEQENFEKDKATTKAPVQKVIKGPGVRGVVLDKFTTESLPFCSVVAKKDGEIVSGTETDMDGKYWLPLESGVYELVFSFAGYHSLTIKDFPLSPNRPSTYTAYLFEDPMTLNEVAIVYEMPLIDGTRSSTIAYDVVNMPVRDINSLAAQLSGVYSADDGKTVPLNYGVNAEEVVEFAAPKPVPLSPTSQVLMAQKGQRTYFTESAIWQPYLVTDTEGKARFNFTWPGNIAPYETHILGVHRNIMTGQTMYKTNVYKLLQARLYQPRYLVAGDSIVVRGSIQNLTEAAFSANLLWHSSLKPDSIITAKEIQRFSNETFTLTSPKNQHDSLQVYFGMRLDNGYFDGEQRKIAVLRQGAAVHRGFGKAVFGDTVFQPQAYHALSPYEFTVHNNTRALALSEAVHLSGYLHSCNEQLSARLVALEYLLSHQRGIEKFIRTRERNKVLKLLEANQQSNGGWSWWGADGQPNLTMTLAIWDNLTFIAPQSEKAAEMLNLAKDQLPQWLNRATNFSDTLQLVLVGLRMGLDLNFLTFTNETPKNLQELLLQEQIKLEGKHIKKTKVLAQKSTTVYGNYLWEDNTETGLQRNTIELTLKALEILLTEEAPTTEVKRTLAGLMELRQGMPFYSTIHSVRFLRLMDALKDYLPTPDIPPVVAYQNQSITEFPFVWKGDSAAVPRFDIQTNNHFLMVSGYQEQWEVAPQKRVAEFALQSWFAAGGKKDTVFAEGSELVQTVSIDMKANGSYLMLEVPLPAGCYIATKRWPHWAKEVAYFDDKVVFYLENIPKGTYTLELPLVAQYAGRFTANPVALRSMYWKHLETFTPAQTLEVVTNKK
jgi:hypothetical protein